MVRLVGSCHWNGILISTDVDHKVDVVSRSVRRSPSRILRMRGRVKGRGEPGIDSGYGIPITYHLQRCDRQAGTTHSSFINQRSMRSISSNCRCLHWLRCSASPYVDADMHLNSSIFTHTYKSRSTIKNLCRSLLQMIPFLIWAISRRFLPNHVNPSACLRCSIRSSQEFT